MWAKTASGASLARKARSLSQRRPRAQARAEAASTGIRQGAAREDSRPTWSEEEALEGAEGIGGEGGLFGLILLPSKVGAHIESNHAQQGAKGDEEDGALEFHGEVLGALVGIGVCGSPK